MGGSILRSEKPTFERKSRFRGRKGFSQNTRSFYFYIVNPKGKESLTKDGIRFISYSEEFADNRGAKQTSKAQLVLDFLSRNADSAYFSKQVYDALKDKGVRMSDVMATVRRYNKLKPFRLVQVRGYKGDEDQTPFKEGFMLTWIDQEIDRDTAVNQATERIEKALHGREKANPVIERVHAIRDLIIESTKLREIVGIQFLQNELGLTEYELECARAARSSPPRTSAQRPISATYCSRRRGPQA